MSAASLLEPPSGIRRSKRLSSQSQHHPDDNGALPGAGEDAAAAREGHSAKKKRKDVRVALADVTNTHTAPMIPPRPPRPHTTCAPLVGRRSSSASRDEELCEDALPGMDTTEDEDGVRRGVGRRPSQSSDDSLDHDELMFSANKRSARERTPPDDAKMQLSVTRPHPHHSHRDGHAVQQPQSLPPASSLLLAQPPSALPPPSTVLLQPRLQSAVSTSSAASSTSSPFSPASSTSSAHSSPPCASPLSAPSSSSLFHSCLPEYGPSLLAYLLRCDVRQLANPRYMVAVQHDLSFAMRAILVDWLIEVCQEYALHPHTLLLAVSYIDRFLSLTPLDRSRLQLLGVSALLLAAKYWEIRPPLIDDFVYISDHTYSRDEVVAMERAVLGVLRWEVGGCSAWDFARYVVWEAGGLGEREEQLAAMMMEMMLMESEWVGCRASVVGGSSVLVGRWALRSPTSPGSAWRDGWSGWERVLRFGAREVEGCVSVMLRLWRRMKEQMKAVAEGRALPGAAAAGGANGLIMKGVMTKYSKPQHGAVAILPLREGSPFDQ